SESTASRSNDNASRSVSQSTWDDIKGAVEQNFAAKTAIKDPESLDLVKNDLYNSQFDALTPHQDSFGNEVIDLPKGGHLEKDRVVNPDGKVEPIVGEPLVRDDGS